MMRAKHIFHRQSHTVVLPHSHKFLILLLFLLLVTFSVLLVNTEQAKPGGTTLTTQSPDSDSNSNDDSRNSAIQNTDIPLHRLCDSHIIRSRRVYLNSEQDAPRSLDIHVSNGVIRHISDWNDDSETDGSDSSSHPIDHEAGCRRLLDVGNHIVMPGMIDTHVHLNEPGRTEWEGFETGTKAAAAGGHTTIIDMPLNSHPPTTNMTLLREKVHSSHQKRFVDLGFLAGIVPENADELLQLVDEGGVLGFKSFMINSTIERVDAIHIRRALSILEKRDRVVYMIHAELETDIDNGGGDPHKYSTYLATRPESFEVSAIRSVIDLCYESSNVQCHIVHVASPLAVPLIREAQQRRKNMGLRAPLTAETCTHYLTFSAEEIPDRATEFKCMPPIREAHKSCDLLKALEDDVLSLITSDHSPSPQSMKSDNFLTSWGGISGIQFSLPALWTFMHRRRVPLQRIIKWKCEEPAKLVGIEGRKGQLAVGYDADIVVWDPDSSFVVTRDTTLHRHTLSPFLGMPLRGVVKYTILRGNVQFYHEHGTISRDNFSFPSDVAATGKVLLRYQFHDVSAEHRRKQQELELLAENKVFIEPEQSLNIL